MFEARGVGNGTAYARNQCGMTDYINMCNRAWFGNCWQAKLPRVPALKLAGVIDRLVSIPANLLT